MHNLNNLYGLIPPAGRRWLFCVPPDPGRRVSRTLFVNWFHTTNISDPFSAQTLVRATWKWSNLGTNIFIFIFAQNWNPIYSFCDYFFEYIGLWVCDDFGVVDSFDKLGPWFENLSELVPTLCFSVCPRVDPGLRKEVEEQETSCFTVLFQLLPKSGNHYIHFA